MSTVRKAVGRGSSLSAMRSQTRNSQMTESDQAVERLIAAVNRLAEANGVTLIKSQASPEKEVGGVYEKTIDCDCEGSLESFVPFLHAIYSEGAMLDVRKLTMRPQTGKGGGGLRAGFTLCCAYMRAEEQGN